MAPTAIFLSASVPDPRRSERYFKTADQIAIAAAVSALVYVTLGRRLLVWGGHPAITPMIWAAANDIGVDYGSWVRLYQSRFFEEDFPEENSRFGNVTYVDAVNNDRDESLGAMRHQMLTDFEYHAGVFIGGMEGVEVEFKIFRQYHPQASVIPLASTGGAALEIYNSLEERSPELLRSLDYIGLLHRELQISPIQERTEEWAEETRSTFSP